MRGWGPQAKESARGVREGFPQEKESARGVREGFPQAKAAARGGRGEIPQDKPTPSDIICQRASLFVSFH